MSDMRFWKRTKVTRQGKCDDPRILMSFRIKPETRKALKKLSKKQGVTMTEVIDTLVIGSAKRRGLT